MVRKSPAFSFYPDSWFGGTLTMPPIQRAAYIDLLGLQWVSGGFSKEDAILVCRGVPEADVQAVLDSKFDEVEPSRFLNSRLEDERQKQSKRAENARQNGRKGGRPKTKDKPTGKPGSKPESKAKPNPREKLSDSDSDSLKDKGKKSFVPPTIEQVASYVREYGDGKSGWPKRSFVAEDFVDYYQSKGWMVGKTKMKDWKAAVRNWGKRDFGNGTESADTARRI